MTAKAWPRPRPKVVSQPGVCFGCGCTDEFACPQGCAWTDERQTMCTECERRARAFLAWSKARTSTRSSREPKRTKVHQ